MLTDEEVEKNTLENEEIVKGRAILFARILGILLVVILFLGIFMNLLRYKISSSSEQDNFREKAF